jgi:hypothetical protein
VEGPSMLDLTSDIQAVTIFCQGAQVERAISLPEGCQGSARLCGLPLSLLDDSVALRVEGAEPRPVVVDFRVLLRVTGATEESDLEQRLEKARQQCLNLATQRTTLQRLLSALSALEPAPRPRGSEGAPLGDYHLEGLLELLDFREKTTAQLDAELLQVEREIEKAQDRLSQLQHQKSQQAPAARPNALEKALVVSLRGTAVEGSRLILEYRVPGARWAPAYSVSFSPALDQAELAMRAVVAQKTGEDWSGVALTLCTADPNERRQPPEWKSLRIGRAGEVSGPRWYPPPAGTEQLFQGFDAARNRFRSQTTTLESGLRDLPPPPPPLPPESSDHPSQKVGASFVPAAPAFQAAPMPALVAPAPLGGSAAAGASVDFQPGPKPGSALPSPFAMPARARSAPGAAQDFYDEATESLSVETTVTVDQRYQRFQSLRLLDFSSPQRGRLVALETLEEYQESRSLTWTREQVVLAMGEALRAASRVEGGQPPPGYAYPGAQSGFDFSYRAEAPVDLASDGAFHTVPVFVTDLTPTISYVCTPRESQQVFRSAAMSNPSGRALPEGPADISVGGDFLHTTPVRAVTPEGVLQLGLGVEQSIKVSRNVHFKEGTSGLMGGTTDLSHTITIEAVNHRPSSVLLEVRESLPAPAEAHKDEMKVLLGPIKPGWESFVPEESPLLKTAYRWKLPLPAGGKVTASATYFIEIPSKYELQGGNRREPRS